MADVILLDNPVLKYRKNSSVPVSVGAVARRIAGLLGGEMRETEGTGNKAYHVPFAAVHAELATARGIAGTGDLYGGVVREHQHADKAILHLLPSVGAAHPTWYSPRFAECVRDVVLPGYTAFTYEDVVDAFNLMRGDGFSVRLKDPANTGGLGQHLVHSSEQLAATMADYTGKLSKTGIVLEADLHGHATVTIGYIDIAGVIYTWYGRPYDVDHEGMTRFGGNELTVVRGSLRELREHSVNPYDRLAIDQAKCVFDAYSLLGTTVSRATLDAVQGTACDGTFMSGITDPSLRPSASSAAEIRAIEALVANPGAAMAKTRLHYDYEKRAARTPSQELFVSHSRMDILVELVDVA
ncbi:MAG TPA: DUF3182 family protein [Candidatus Saccharimonadales bacterium]|nr:DUF3182 family protein [Candidatus Saccharimonadales bacterium]